MHHLYPLPLGSHLIRVQPELRWSHKPATGAASAAALLAAYSSALTGALIEHFRRGSQRGINGYPTAMTAVQTISSGGTGAAHVNRGVSLAQVHCAIFCSYRNGIHINSPENVSANF